MQNNFLHTFFSIKSYTLVSPQELKNGYLKMVDGLWYRLFDNGELDIVINFKVEYEVDETKLKESSSLLTALARLSGEKSSISSLIPRLKEKGSLVRELLNNYQDNLEDTILSNEKQTVLKELETLKQQYSNHNQLDATNKVKLKDNTERLAILYKSLKKDMDDEGYEKKLNDLQKEQEHLLIKENEYKIHMETLKEDITYYSKLLRKPLTNVDLEKMVKKDENYKKIKRQLHDIANVLEYVERQDKSQDEKSLIIRSIKSVVVSDFNEDKKTIKFS